MGAMLVFGLAGCGAHPRPPTTQSIATVQGVVVDDSTGRPLEDALVILMTQPLREVRTDAAGRFAFDSVAAGRYSLRASAIGYATADTLLVSIQPNTARVVVDTIRLAWGVWSPVGF